MVGFHLWPLGLAHITRIVSDGEILDGSGCFIILGR